MFGAEGLAALLLGNRVVARQHVGQVQFAGFGVEARCYIAVVGLPDGWRPKVRPDGAAQRQIVVKQAPAGGQLAIERFTDAGMMLKPTGGGEQHIGQDIGLQVEIRAKTVPAGLGRLCGRRAWVAGDRDREALSGQHVVTEIGIWVPGSALKSLFTVLQAESDVQRRSEQADVEWPGEVQVEYLVPLLVPAGSVLGRNRGLEADQIRIHAVPEVGVHAVLTEPGAHIVVPAVQQGVGAAQTPAQAEYEAPVVHDAPKPGGEPARECLGQAVAVVLACQRGQGGRALRHIIARRDRRAVTGHPVRGQVGDQ